MIQNAWPGAQVKGLDLFSCLIFFLLVGHVRLRVTGQKVVLVELYSPNPPPLYFHLYIYSHTKTN
jgi:hypothetical protein